MTRFSAWLIVAYVVVQSTQMPEWYELHVSTFDGVGAFMSKDRTFLDDLAESLNQAHERLHRSMSDPGTLFIDKNDNVISPCGSDDCGKESK